MQGGGEVQAGPSGTATPACGARGGRPRVPAFVRLCAPHEKTNATLRVAPCSMLVVGCCESRSNGPGIVHTMLH
eukprot:3824360-Prymnesium_polylepis.1